MKLKSYQEYKDSKVEWVGDIPNSWKMLKIGHLGNFQNGNGFPESLQGQEKGDIPFLKVSDINDPNLITVNIANNYVSSKIAAEHKWNIIPKNSIIFPKIGEAINKNHRKINTVEVIIDNNLSALCIDDNFFYKYLFYIFKELNMNDFLNVSAVPSINMNLLKNHKFPITPNLEEQKFIVYFLDKKTSEIDKTIEKDTKLIKLLKEKRNALINHAVTKGLDPDVKMKDSGVEWIGEIPEEWDISKFRRGIKFLTDFEANGSFSTIKENVNLEPKIPFAWYVRATDLENDRYGLIEKNQYCDEYTYNFLKKTKLEGGELLVAKRGEIGKVYLMPEVNCPSTLAPNLYLIKLNSKLNPKFTFYWFLSNLGRDQLILNNKSTTIGALYKDDIKDCFCIFPPFSEQEKIVDYLNQNTFKIDRTIQKIEKKIKIMEEYKKSLIHHVVTGKVDVRGDDSLNQIHQKKDSRQTSLII